MLTRRWSVNRCWILIATVTLATACGPTIEAPVFVSNTSNTAEVLAESREPAAQLVGALRANEEPEAVEQGPDLARLIAAEDTGVSSEAMSCGLFNPMPDGFAAGYAADTGLDLAGMKVPVFAIAAGKVDYAEGGHSLWSGRGDTDLAVRIELDEPIAISGNRTVTHVWYAHLSGLAFEQKEGAEMRLSVKAGQQLGVSGRANGMWHLHLGLLLDGDTSQHWGTFLLEDEVREVLCGLRPRTRLPKR